MCLTRNELTRLATVTRRLMQTPRTAPNSSMPARIKTWIDVAAGRLFRGQLRVCWDLAATSCESQRGSSVALSRGEIQNLKIPSSVIVHIYYIFLV